MDRKAGLLMSAFVLVYAVVIGIMYFYNKSLILADMVEFAAQYGIVQNTLLKELSIPYAILLDLSLIISVKIIEFQAYRFILFLWKYAPVQLRNIFTQIGILPDSRPKDFPELCVRPDDFSIIQ